MTTALRLAILVPLVIVATAACLRVDVAFIINEDGTGVIDYTLAVSDDLADYAGEDDLDFTEDLGDLPEGAGVREYSEDGYTGVVVSIPVDDFTDLTRLAEDLDLPLDVSVVDKDGAWEFQALVPALNETVEDELDFDLGIAVDEIEEAFVKQFLEGSWFRVRVSLPGELVEHNADRIEDDVLVWELDLASTQDRKLTARSAPGGGPPLDRIIAIGVFAGLVVVSAAFLASRRPRTRPRVRRL